MGTTLKFVTITHLTGKLAGVIWELAVCGYLLLVLHCILYAKKRLTKNLSLGLFYCTVARIQRPRLHFK
jgi:hypothetical protein